MAFIQFYLDSACTRLWAALPVTELEYSNTDSPPYTITIGEKSYRYFDGYGMRFRNVVAPTENPQFLTSRNSFPTATTLYCKNGLSFSITVSNNSGGNQYMQISQVRAGGVTLSIGQNLQDANPIKMYLASIIYQGVTYIGFTQPRVNWSSVVIPTAFIESSFWNSAFRPAYDYGTKPDGNGGQGEGRIPHTPIGFSTKPTISLPTGGHGLHAYRIDAMAYDDLQSYLWGQGSTLAKNLWQKFVNSKTNPAGCVVACYRLPALFMPSGTVTDGIKIAGVKMPRGSGIIREVVLGFTDYAVKIGHVAAPFGSWADYCGATVTISIPLCGEFTAPLEKVWDKDVFVKYRVDLSNGNLVGMACSGTCANDGSSYSMEYILGEMSGNVAYNVPISGGDDGTLARIGAAIGLASNVVSGVITSVQNVASTFAGGNGGSNMTPGEMSAVAGVRGGVGAAMTSSSLHSISDIVMPPFQAHLINPNLSGNMSACSNGIAYAEYQIACIAYPPNYGDVMGYPARSSGGLLRDFTGGYGEFYVSADFDIHGATYEEKEEIVALLESGVFV